MALWAAAMDNSDFWEEMDGFGLIFVEFVFDIFEGPGMVTVFASECTMLDVDRYFGVFEFGGVGFHDVVDGEAEEFLFDLLEFADVDDDFGDGIEFFFISYFKYGGNHGFSKCPFMHWLGDT